MTRSWCWKILPATGSGNEATAGGATRYARSGIHGALNEPVAGSGVPPAAVNGRIAGRLLREFAVTLSVAIGISLLVSLTLTPMMCGWMLKSSAPREQSRKRGFGRVLVALQQSYGTSLKWVLRHTRLVGVVLLGTIALNIWLYISIPKTFFPEQDTGVLMGDSGRPEHLFPGDARQTAGLYEDHPRRPGGE